MKKIIALVLVFVLAMSLAACAKKADIHAKSEGTMTHDEYVAAAMESEVTIEAFVQAKQSWWDNKGTFYLQDKDGAYFLYEMPCTEEEYNKLTVGTKIKVTGYKTQWDGQVEIVDTTFEILEGTWEATAADATAWLGTAELENHRDEKVAFKGMTVEAIEYKNGAPGDDIYLTLGKDGASYNFCVEIYLTGEDTDVYKTVTGLNVGDVIDVEAFLYWYLEDANPHVIGVTAAK